MSYKLTSSTEQQNFPEILLCLPPVVCLSRGFPPTPSSVTVQSLAATAISLKCTLQFKPAHQSQATLPVTVGSNICTTKGRQADSSTPPCPRSLSLPLWLLLSCFVFRPKIPFYPCDPPPLCTNLLVPIAFTASVLDLPAPGPPHPAPHWTHIMVWRHLHALLLRLAQMKHELKTHSTW